MGVWDTVGRSLAEGFWMFFDTLWALVLGFALSGAVQAFASRAQMQRLLGDHRPVTVARAGFFGMVSSSCSYAASALAKSLFAKGADFTSSMVFMFASTNLVIELGIVLWLLMGWQFAVAEFVGGAVMIAILAVVLPRLLRTAEVEAARERLNAGAGHASTGHEGHGDVAPDDRAAPWQRRIRTRAGWSDASGYTISDLTMLRKELVIGFVVAGFASMAVPTSVWRALFFTGHGFWATVENVVVGPFLAFISFVCSVGNVPLAAALWKGGISFGGVIAFVFADLLAFPLVVIYRKFFGTRLAVKLSLVFWAVMSTAGLVTEGIFSLANLVPSRARGDIATTHLGWNYTTILNVVALVAFGYLYRLYRNRDRFGAGTAYAKDPVCGMQVQRAAAPMQTTHLGEQVYFCSDRCHDRFTADPAGYATGDHGDNHHAGDETATDPMCGMTVDPATAISATDQEGRPVRFCSPGCRAAYLADPSRYAATQAQQ